MTSFYDIENCYKFILGRPINEDERNAIGQNLLQLTDIPLDEHRRRFLGSNEFHQRHSELLFDNFVPKSIFVLFETKYNFKLYLDLRQYHISFGIMSGEYEKFDIDLVKAILPDNGQFIDVGGNVGYYSLSAAAHPSFKGTVLAFEPLPKLWDLFNRSILENGFEDRVSVRQLALADAPGEMQLNDAEETVNAGATRLVTNASDTGVGRMTKVETLDHVIGNLRPDVMKVDIEGAEGLFLKGAQKTIATHKPSLLMEINRDMLAVLSKTTPGAIHRQLADLGYNIWTSSQDQLAQVASPDELDRNFSVGTVANILAVHDDRVDQVNERVQRLGVALAPSGAKRQRLKEAAL
ncbi:FkbM family methyltransferase [Rhizobium lusitanum]|uniref:FkbM family methyltransferase n=1 Tax=Rhizobium lusitanum TaxID=293958 RepID=UPI001955F57E|nr:FkbM family methyltransferase [Rhizobium lusitanum]MBM7047482.1 FkbM family methyltransferase [Rhizobium lusitanum]